MGTPAVGSVVLVDFPYSDLSKLKKRPALVIGLADYENIIVCQITSKKFPNRLSTSLSDKDFKAGELQLDSFIRPDKIHTLGPNLVERTVGIINDKKMAEVRNKLAELFELAKTS